MKILKLALVGVLAFSAAAAAQTIELGQNVFSSSQGEIVLTIDAALAVRKLDSPYVMFMAFMVVMGGQSLVVNRDDVTMSYNGQDIKMPSLKEWRSEYKGALGDISLYNRLGKETLVLSHLRDYQFPSDQDFFPILGRGPLPTDQGSMAGMVGFRTKLYFKNPGFKKGDQIVISVRDKNDPEVVGSCAVILK
ncbi:MAG: hypothetical protein A2W03_06790 [Candidatus Aminicenantes bacterium RBG_16_63_16]|nr:MAG: hypothetical protein A2W03_06790 [Candidatus Aminicenantes bacterium RBG_16_63_16]